jgi:hypothetical protein
MSLILSTSFLRNGKGIRRGDKGEITRIQDTITKGGEEMNIGWREKGNEYSFSLL